MVSPEIQNLVHDLLHRMGISVEAMQVIESPVHPLLTITSTDSKLLIGPQGDHLKAINYIIKRIVEHKYPGEELNFLIDVNGYHKHYIEEIQNKAKVLAQRVRTFKTSVEMSPMNAYDRMIVHATFSQDGDIKTESSGEGKFRHVVLSYKGEGSKFTL